MDQFASNNTEVAALPLAWSDRFSIGVPAIDADHQLLFELAGMLEGMTPASPAWVIDQLLSALAEYSAVHFEREEQYQQAIGYPGIAAHQRQHRKFSAHVARLKEQFARDPALVDIKELQRYLRHWLVLHVLHDDMQFGHYQPTAAA